jgi:hypothetical protein
VSSSESSLNNLRSDVPSVRRALPPVGWQRTEEQDAQRTTVWACEKTVVMVKLCSVSSGACDPYTGDSPAGALDVHKVRVRASASARQSYVAARGTRHVLHQALELVLLGLGLRRRVEQIDGERLSRQYQTLVHASMTRVGGRVRQGLIGYARPATTSNRPDGSDSGYGASCRAASRHWRAAQCAPDQESVAVCHILDSPKFDIAAGL